MRMLVIRADDSSANREILRNIVIADVVIILRDVSILFIIIIGVISLIFIIKANLLFFGNIEDSIFGKR